MRIAGLNIFPVKSARSIALDRSPISALGLAGDRRWMVIDPSGYFITQREFPALAQLETTLLPQGLRLSMAGKGQLEIAASDPERRQDVVVWRSSVSAALAGDAVNDTLSDWLGRAVRLVHFDDRATREASPEWAGPGTPVSFADGYQVLVTTTGSLAALNANMAAHGEAPVGMERFRANIVIDHDEAWAEDGWGALEIGGVVLYLVKPCARCIMTTQDQTSGSRDGASPMPAMGRIRMSGDRRVPGPLFGWNVVPVGDGVLSVGDAVNVLDRREPFAIKRR